MMDAIILRGHRTLSVSQVLLTNKMDHMIRFQEAAFVHPGCSFNWFTTSRRYRKLKKPLHYGGSQRNEFVNLSVLCVQAFASTVGDNKVHQEPRSPAQSARP